MKKKLIILIILLIPLLSGCNYRELNNLSIVDIMSIDYVDDKYLVTIEVLNLDKENNDEDKTFNGIVYQASGVNLTDAVSNLSLSTPKKIYLGHLELLIISDSVISKLNDITSFFIDNNEVNKNFSVLLSNTPSNEILNSKDLLSSYPYGSIIGSLKNSSLLSGISSDTKFLQLAYNLNTDYRSLVIPTIKLENDNIYIDNLAIINDNKIIGYLDNKYNLGYNFMTNNIDDAIISYKCDNNKYNGVKITNSNTKIKSYIDNDKFGIRVYINGNIYMIENECDEGYNSTLDNTSKELKNIISSVIDYSKNDINVDIFQIGTLLYKYHNKYYNSINFRDMYKNMDYKIITKLEMR